MGNNLNYIFIREVEKLKFRFPVAKIVEDTGYSSGIVSEYLANKKKVSEKFLKKFCSTYKLDYETVLKNEEPNKQESHTTETNKQEALIEQLYGRLRDKEAIIEGLQAQIMYLSQEVERVSKIPDSLGKGEGASINKNVKDA